MALPMWLWHPKVKQLNKPVLVENYRAMCSSKSVLKTFKIGTYVSIVLLPTLGIIAFLCRSFFENLPNYEVVKLAFYYCIVIWPIEVPLRLIVIRTLRPLFMQLYLVFYVICQTLSFLLLGLICIDAYLMFDSISRTPRIPHKFSITKIVDLLGFGGCFAALLVFGVLPLLGGILMIKYDYGRGFAIYHYIRDRQLEIEESESDKKNALTVAA